jgi:hypothetical protein
MRTPINDPALKKWPDDYKAAYWIHVYTLFPMCMLLLFRPLPPMGLVLGVGIGWILAEYVKTLIGFFWQSANDGTVRGAYIIAAIVKACFAAPMVSLINSEASSALLIILWVATTIASSWEDIEVSEEYHERSRG